MSMEPMRKPADNGREWDGPGDPRYAYSGANERGWGQGGSGDSAAHGLANALGWISLGLGLAGVAAPSEVARMIGVPDNERTRDLLRTVGIREILHGIGILALPGKSGWVWTRVAGDAMDLALLGSALGSEETDRGRVVAATAAIAGITALDLYCSREMGREAASGPLLREGPPATERIAHTRAITIYRTPEEVYGFWRDLRNLPRFMRHLQSVEVLDERTSRWRAEAPLGASVAWEAEIIEDRPNELIAWRSLPGSHVYNCGRVTFQPAPGRKATEVRIEMEYAPPGGRIGATVATLFGKEPKQQLQDDLRAFKQVLETGEIVRSEGSLVGIQFPQHPAQRPASRELDRLAA